MSFRSWIGQTFGLFGDSARRAWASFSGSGEGTSGESVTPERAMAVMAFWRGVRLKATTVGTLPPSIYRIDPATGLGVKDTANQYDVVARQSPNEYQTRTEFWEGMEAARIVLGNGYARKVRLGKRLVALEPLNPHRTYPWRNSQGKLRYRGWDWVGTYFPDLAPEDVFHLKGFGFGGDSGLSALTYGAGALGLSMAAQRVASDTFASGLSSSGFLETGQVLDEPDRKRLEEIMSTYQKNQTPGKMMILEGGMKFNKLALSSVDAQLLETMGFGIEEIARLLDLPPILLGHNAQGQTQWGTGVEAVIQAWYNLGLRSDLTRIETSFGKRVIDPEDQGKFYLKINVDGILRGDTQTRAMIAAAMAQNGLRNRDELRALDDEPPIPDGSGKLYTAQTNLAPLDKLGQSNAAPAADPVQAAIRNMIAAEFEARDFDERLRQRPN